MQRKTLIVEQFILKNILRKQKSAFIIGKEEKTLITSTLTSTSTTLIEQLN